MRIACATSRSARCAIPSPHVPAGKLLRSKVIHTRRGSGMLPGLLITVCTYSLCGVATTAFQGGFTVVSSRHRSLHGAATSLAVVRRFAVASSGQGRAACRAATSDGTEGSCDEDEEELKLVICVRTDLQMSLGKACAQVGHAVHGAVRSTSAAVLEDWEKHGSKKVTVEVDTEEQLKELQREASQLGLVTELIEDEGRTEIEPGTQTVLAIGPAPESKVNAVTGRLRLLRDPVQKLERDNAKLLKRIDRLEKELSAKKLELYTARQRSDTSD